MLFRSTLVSQREVVELCLKHHAVAITLVHNHPSGLCDPSPEDLALTQCLQAALFAVSVRLNDHVIVSSHSAWSMRRAGQIRDL